MANWARRGRRKIYRYTPPVEEGKTEGEYLKGYTELLKEGRVLPQRALELAENVLRVDPKNDDAKALRELAQERLDEGN